MSKTIPKDLVPVVLSLLGYALADTNALEDLTKTERDIVKDSSTYARLKALVGQTSDPRSPHNDRSIPMYPPLCDASFQTVVDRELGKFPYPTTLGKGTVFEVGAQDGVSRYEPLAPLWSISWWTDRGGVLLQAPEPGEHGHGPQFRVFMPNDGDPRKGEWTLSRVEEALFGDMDRPLSYHDYACDIVYRVTVLGPDGAVEDCDDADCGPEQGQLYLEWLNAP